MSLRYPVLMLLYSICSYYKWFEEERYLPRRGNPRSLACKTALPYLWEWHPIYSVSHMHVCKVRGKGEIHVHSSSDLAAYHCVEPFHCKQMVLKNVTQAFHSHFVPMLVDRLAVQVADMKSCKAFCPLFHGKNDYI